MFKPCFKKPSIVIILQTIILAFGGWNVLNAQDLWERFETIELVENGQTKNLAWAGGVDAPQLSPFDLDMDGVMDMVLFDRQGHVLKPFINQGISDSISFVYAPEYIPHFPEMSYFALFRDYNCDGKQDLFTYAPGGFKVYKNTSQTGGFPEFSLEYPLLKSNYNPSIVNLYVSSQDIAAIDDIDGDGDLDILTFGVMGTMVEFHRNMSMENHGNCDTLEFELSSGCWGDFYENANNNSVTLGFTCKSQGTAGEDLPSILERHSGSTLLTFDADGDMDKELVLGDVSFSEMVFLENGGDQFTATITSQYSGFPNGTVAVDLTYPAGYLFDANNDGVSDLIAAPNTATASPNKDNFWLYLNSGTNGTPIFSLTSKSFLQSSMIDHGSMVNPTVVDVNGDGLLDLICGNYGVYNSSGLFDGYLSYYVNTGTTANPVLEWVTNDFAGSSSLGLNGLHPAFGDLDGDQDLDMMVGDFNGQLFYFENTAGFGNPMSLTLTTPNFMGIDVGQFAAPQLVDLNKDGVLDLIIGERGGRVKYFENTGTQQAAVFSSTATNDFLGEIDVMIPCCTGFSVPRYVLDQSGDGFMMVGSESGKIYFYENVDGNLNGSFTKGDSIETYTSRVSPFYTNIKGDSLPELVIGEAVGGLFWMERNTLGSIQNIQEKNVFVYPNPANDLINVVINQSVHPSGKIFLYDLKGRVLLETRFSSNEKSITLDIGDVSPGVYLLNLSTFDFQLTKRLVKW